MKAIILCAGYGTRMKPYTNVIQKTMIPVHGQPLLEYIIKALMFAGFKEFILVVNYLKNQIIDYFQDGSRWKINITYVVQEKLNGTGGALLACKDFVSESHLFLVWGDILVPFRTYMMVRQLHEVEKYDYVMVANHKEDLSKGGAVYCVDTFCHKIVEKEPKGTGTTKLNNCGVFVLSREIFSVLEEIEVSERGELELTKALNQGILLRNWKVRVLKMEIGAFRGDFGNIKEYESLRNDPSWIQKLFK
ncbi:MAG: nucleotidyltransferase family protein [Candidatus Lokiarchaeota archaeon]|nr:nucleotidyltransferase family protein [Candidatus Lokiarchaeota archaeon]